MRSAKMKWNAGPALCLSSLALDPHSCATFSHTHNSFSCPCFVTLLQCDGEPVKREDEEKLDEVSLRAQLQLAPVALSAFTVWHSFHAIRPATTQTQTYVILVFAFFLVSGWLRRSRRCAQAAGHDSRDDRAAASPPDSLQDAGSQAAQGCAAARTSRNGSVERCGKQCKRRGREREQRFRCRRRHTSLIAHIPSPLFSFRCVSPDCQERR